MIAGILLLAQLAAATPAPSLATFVVKDGTRSVRVQTVSTTGRTLVDPMKLRPVLDVLVSRRGSDDFIVRIGRTELTMRPGLPYVRYADTLRQLGSAPALVKGQLLVPMQVIAEIIPAALRTGVMWDAERRELRRFSPTPARAPAVAQRTAPPRRDPVPRSAGRAAGAQRRLVVIDPGHGGRDRGMSGPLGDGPRIQEKDITLQVARRVGAKLKAMNVDVLFTRTRDTLVSLSDRGRIANDAGGDLFISIHVNAANPNWKSPGGARGFETYFLAEAKTEDARRVEQMENESIQFEEAEDTRKGDPLSFIVADMLQNEHLRESSDLAELIQRRLGASHPGPSRGVKQAGFRVLVTAFMPSVLVEVGFGTNPDEARYMSSAAGQEQLANAIVAGTLEYLERYERRVGGGAGE